MLKSDLASSKPEVDERDIDKLNTIPTDSSKKVVKKLCVIN